MDKLTAIPIGLLVSTAVGALFTRWAYSFLEKKPFIPKKQLNTQSEQDEVSEFEQDMLSLYVGIVERTIYFFCALANAYTLIAGWLVLKSFSHFKEEQATQKKGLPMKIYKRYIIGVGISLIFGVLGGVISRHLLGIDFVEGVCTKNPLKGVN